MRAINNQPTAPSSEMTMLDVLRIMHEAEKLQKRTVRKPRHRSLKYVLLLWDAEGNQYGTGRHEIFTKDEGRSPVQRPRHRRLSACQRRAVEHRRD